MRVNRNLFQADQVRMVTAQFSPQNTQDLNR